MPLLIGVIYQAEVINLNKKTIENSNLDIFSSAVWIYLFVILLFAILSFVVGKIYLGILELVLFFGLVIFDYLRKSKKNKQILAYMQNLTYHVDTAAKDSLLYFPMPMTILRVDGRITWYNNSFRELFISKERFGDLRIQDFIPDINWFEIIKGTQGIHEDIFVGNRRFQMLGNVVKTQSKSEKDDYVVLLYWVEKTELYALQQQQVDEKVDVAIFMIDNYDDIAGNMDDVLRAQILSSIDKKIRECIKDMDGVLSKLHRDRYMFVFANKHLKTFEQNRFSVLQDIRNVSTSYNLKTPFTMSIGVGVDGNSLAENESFAKTSIDMAMGRGGDQAVIKKQDDFKFFGGNHSEYEKNTRVKTKIVAQAFRELVSNSDQILVMGHKNPDMDSFGASIGVYRAAVSIGKTCYVMYDPTNKNIKDSMDSLRNSEEYANVFITHDEAYEVLNDKSLLVVVDVHRPSIVQEPKLLEKAKNIVVIDHHRRAAEFIDNASLVYHEPYASSTSEMVTEILQYVGSGVKLTKMEAEALYAGIVVDTKSFTFKTGVRTFEAASYLKKYGVDTIAIKRLFQTDFQDYKLRSNIVANAEIVKGNMAISTCELPNLTANERSIIVAQAADELLDIAGISASFVLCATPDNIIISARSLDDVNVQVILETMGGGGHRTVAGVQLTDQTMEQAKQQLIDAIEKYLADNQN